jgi:hypothetical protein
LTIFGNTGLYIIFILLYADDTVLISENVNGMQTMLNIFSEYCNTWKLQVNIAKTNVVIFSKSNVTQKNIAKYHL